MDASLSSLAGQDEHYLVDAMKAYQDGRNSNPAMMDFVKSLSERDLEDIAAFYASQHTR
jgi:cytochrome c553